MIGSCSPFNCIIVYVYEYWLMYAHICIGLVIYIIVTFKLILFIFQNEEEERSTKWRIFLQPHSELGQTNSSFEEDVSNSEAEVTHKIKHVLESIEEEYVNSDEIPTNDNQTENVFEKLVSEATKTQKPVVRNWAEVRASLNTIENMMSHRVKNERKHSPEKHLQTIQEVGPTSEDSDEELQDNEQEASAEVNPESMFPWKELESLVREGVPRDLRGEVIFDTPFSSMTPQYRWKY